MASIALGFTRPEGREPALNASTFPTPATLGTTEAFAFFTAVFGRTFFQVLGMFFAIGTSSTPWQPDLDTVPGSDLQQPVPFKVSDRGLCRNQLGSGNRRFIPVQDAAGNRGR
jgi:hypothetical protein